jgi:hypothetical protein
MFEDDYVKTHTWIWDGKPHWAYNSDQVNFLKNKEQIEWTPNTLRSTVNIDDNNAQITLISVTPNLREYQLYNEGEWKRCDSTVRIELNQQKHELAFRTMNTAGVSGPEHRVLIAAQ